MQEATHYTDEVLSHDRIHYIKTEVIAINVQNIKGCLIEF